MDSLTLTSPSFAEGGPIPRRHTGFGEDLSPALCLSGLSPEAISLVVTMDDLDVPFTKIYSHWLIWNLPPQAELPEGIPHGPVLPELGGAAQGVGYGKHGYRGPYPPPFLRTPHRYVFHVYALDCRLELSPEEKRRALLPAMKGHILQEASLMGTFQRT